MTTERLNILSAAVALRQFTVAELVAYSGSNASTVRQIMRKESADRELFQSFRLAPSSRGRQQMLWRLTKPDAALDEIAREEALLRRLHAPPQSSGPSDDEANLLG
jgi:hypothetical protein